MKTFIKITSVIFLITTIFWSFGIKNTSAVVEQYYGGRRLATIQCTCSPASLILLYDYRLKTIINLVYVPGVSRLFMNYNIYTSSYMLGSYNPTIGVGICQFYAGTACVDSSTIGLPAWGTMDMLPGAGTSSL
jgi:hypothetical protein